MTESRKKKSIVLVNDKDEIVGNAEKLEAHQKGWLHRAFSVFIYRLNQNSSIELLLQKRQLGKYHSGGLWTNTCCSHPKPDEDIKEAATQRLLEEMGLCASLTFLGKFCYKAYFENGLIEHEWDYVFSGKWQGEAVTFDSQEVQNYRWEALDQIILDLAKHPQKYTPWFKRALDFVNEGAIQT